MPSNAAATLDLVPIRRAQRAAHCSLHKRMSASREAQRAVAVARGQAAQALAEQQRAEGAVAAAQQEHDRALAACALAGRCPAGGGVAVRTDGNEVMALVRYCERTAQQVSERHAALNSAQELVAQAMAQVQMCARAWAKAEQRVTMVREQIRNWGSREQLAIEMHADLALEDEPPRKAHAMG
jgi:hypothetical protein